MRVLALLMVLASAARAAGPAPVWLPVWEDRFERTAPAPWGIYDNWDRANARIDVVKGLNGRCLRVRTSDKSTITWLDKGAAFRFDPPIPFDAFDVIACAYRVDKPVGNVRFIISETDGDWWHYCDRTAKPGKPGRMVAHQDDITFGWTNAKKSDRRKDTSVKTLLVSFHNAKPVNSGVHFEFLIDDVGFHREIVPAARRFSAEPMSGFALATRAERPVAVNGRLDDWAHALPLAVRAERQVSVKGPGWKGSADLAALAFVKWDKERLYFAARVADDTVCCGDEQRDGDLSMNDYVRFCFDFANNGSSGNGRLASDDYVFIVNPRQPGAAGPRWKTFSYDGVAAPAIPSDGVELAAQVLQWGYEIEAAVSWQAVRRSAPKEGEQIGFQFIVGDSDEPGRRKQEMIWFPREGRYWCDPSLFGKLAFTRVLSHEELMRGAVRLGSALAVTDRQEYGYDQRAAMEFFVPWPLDAHFSPRLPRVTSGLRTLGRCDPLAETETPLGSVWRTAWDSNSFQADSCQVEVQLDGPGELAVFRRLKLVGAELAALEREKTDSRSAARRLAGGPLRPSWTREPLLPRTRLKRLQPVKPAEWTRVQNPVTRGDLGRDFIGVEQCGLSASDLDLHFKRYDFGRAVKPHAGYLLRDNWQEMAQNAIDRGIRIISYWGYVPFRPWNGGFGEFKVSDEKHHWLVEHAGRSFLGYELGEQDGRYIGSYGPRIKPANRREAYDDFMRWHRKIDDDLQHSLDALGSLNFSHAYGELGCRILGLEVAQGLPSDTLEWAFLRGACRQYGLLSWNLISVYNRFGWKNYMASGKRGNHEYGPEHGTSVSLFKRLWYTTYMYGANLIGVEAAEFLKDKQDGVPLLSPVGKIQTEGVAWAKRHADRGTLYAPVALLLDHYSGWAPPRHLYSGKRFLVWGNTPYSKGDHAIDAFFRFIWPTYEDCSYFRDERGFLTPTPCGDKFDVLTTRAHARSLAEYPTIVALGDIEFEPAFLALLRKYVANGGDLFADAEQAGALGAEATGLVLAQKIKRGYASVLLSASQALNEEPYVYRDVAKCEAQVLAVTGCGDPLVVVHPFGRGRVITVLAERYVSKLDLPEDPDPNTIPPHYGLLKCVKKLLYEYFVGYDPIAIEGPAIEYLVNLTEDARVLLLTLVNNDRSKQWRGVVRLRRGDAAGVIDWMTGQPMASTNALELVVDPGDLRILKIERKLD